MFDREGFLHAAANKALAFSILFATSLPYLRCRNAQSQKHRESARADLVQASNTILAKIDTCTNGGELALQSET